MRAAVFGLLLCTACGSSNVTNVYENPPVESGADSERTGDGDDAGPDAPQSKPDAETPVDAAPDAGPDVPVVVDAVAPQPPFDAGNACAGCSAAVPQGSAALNCTPAWGPYSYALYCPPDCTNPPTPVNYTAVSYGDYDSGIGYWCIYMR